MGYPMAVNLRSKIDSSTTLVVCDTNKRATKKFCSELNGKGPIVEVETAAEAAKRAVRPITSGWPSGSLFLHKP